MQHRARFASAAKYRDVREAGVLEGGNCLSVRVRNTKTRGPQRGADEVDTDAGCALRPRYADQTDQAQLRAASK